MGTSVERFDKAIHVRTISGDADEVQVVFTFVVTPDEARELAQSLEACANDIEAPPPRDGDRYGDLTWWQGEWRNPSTLEHLKGGRP